MEAEAPFFADRSERAKLEVTGPQRAWFLDQILTQRFEDIAPGDARDSAMLTVHGRMTAYLETIATDDSILCHYEQELGATFPETLRRYVFATQVEIADVTDRYGLILVGGPAGWRGVLERAQSGGRVHATRALGVDAVYLWVAIAERAETIARLAALGFEPFDERRLDELRIANGVPRWGAEIDSKTFPQEVGIDEHAVHYDKGCYLGQEAMAKIHFRGKVNRRLVRVVADGELRSPNDVTRDGDRVGTITSAAGTRGLALVKHTIERDTVLDANGVHVTVVD